MATVPVNVPYRPFGVCPPTNLMNTDGFFIVNMGDQYIQTDVSNETDADLVNVRAYIEGTSDLGVVIKTPTQTVGTVPAGSFFPIRFLANFHAANPGITRISIIFEADGFSFKRILKKIFITRVDYDKTNKTYTVVMPEGSMKIKIHRALMGPGKQVCKNDNQKAPFIVLPQNVSYEWIPTPPYSGTHGPLPYGDPWWKIALAILAALLALGALLYDYFSDGDLDGGSISVSGTFEETDPSVSCCTSVDTAASDEDDWIARGLYGAVGSVATAAIASDDPDLHWRGQEATPPANRELTVSEVVRLKIDYVVPPNTGHKFPIKGQWQYLRTTNAQTYSYEAEDDRENTHWLESYEVETPALYDRTKGPLVIRARFKKPGGEFHKGNQLYVTGWLVNTTGLAIRFNLNDHGMDGDLQANDGWYTAHGSLPVYRDPSNNRELSHYLKAGRYRDITGTWYLFIFAQDVNTVLEGTDPFKAAHTIGGFVLTSQLSLNFNQPCQLLHDAVIQIV